MQFIARYRIDRRASTAVADGSLAIDPGNAHPGAEATRAIELTTVDGSPHQGNRLA